MPELRGLARQLLESELLSGVFQEYREELRDAIEDCDLRDVDELATIAARLRALLEVREHIETRIKQLADPD